MSARATAILHTKWGFRQHSAPRTITISGFNSALLGGSSPFVERYFPLTGFLGCYCGHYTLGIFADIAPHTISYLGSYIGLC